MKKKPAAPKTSARRSRKPEPRIQWSTTLREDLIRALVRRAAEEAMRTGRTARISDFVERYIAEGLARDKRGAK